MLPAVAGMVALLAPELNVEMLATPAPVAKVTLWFSASEFVHVTVPPLATRTVAGLNLSPLISTLAATGAAVAPPPPPPPPPPVPGPVLSEPPQARSAASGTRMRRERMVLLMGEVETDRW